MVTWLLLLAGLAVLTLGADALVRGGTALALRLGLTPLVIGLTVVAYGTSSPEMVVSAQASARGEGAIAVGNVIGSNICNIALILGLSALFKPLRASVAVVRRELPLLILVTLVSGVLLLDGHLSRLEGAILTAGLVAYTTATVRAARREPAGCAAQIENAPAPARPLWRAVTLTLAGLGALIWGADLFVEAAVRIATGFGISHVVIGLTIVAVGTSMPELATSLVAVHRGQVDVAVGNVVGSCVFNLLGILGVSALIRPLDAPDLRFVDLAVLLATALLLVPMARSGGQISRREGIVLLVIFAGYTGWMLHR